MNLAQKYRITINKRLKGKAKTAKKMVKIYLKDI
jgi:hypothetical protein